MQQFLSSICAFFRSLSAQMPRHLPESRKKPHFVQNASVRTETGRVKTRGTRARKRDCAKRIVMKSLVFFLRYM